jgi:hypothetical protein
MKLELLLYCLRGHQQIKGRTYGCRERHGEIRAIESQSVSNQHTGNSPDRYGNELG